MYSGEFASARIVPIVIEISSYARFWLHCVKRSMVSKPRFHFLYRRFHMGVLGAQIVGDVDIPGCRQALVYLSKMNLCDNLPLAIGANFLTGKVEPAVSHVYPFVGEDFGVVLDVFGFHTDTLLSYIPFVKKKNPVPKEL